MKHYALLIGLIFAACANQSAAKHRPPRAVADGAKGEQPIADLADGTKVTAQGTLFYFPAKNHYFLCQGVIATSLPPRCGGARLTLHDVDKNAAAAVLTGVDTLNNPPTVLWAETGVKAHGTIGRGGVVVQALK